MDINKKNIYRVLKVLLFLSVPISIWLFLYLKRNSIKENKCFSIAKITKLHRSFKGNYSFLIEFKDDKNNLILDKCSLHFGPDTSIVNKYFLVVYNCKNSYEYELLIEKSDYDLYSLPYPDSMKWVNKYFD